MSLHLKVARLKNAECWYISGTTLVVKEFLTRNRSNLGHGLVHLASGSMRGTTHASPDDIDITSIWGALRRSAKALLFFAILTGGLTYAVLAMMAPQYMSEAQLTVAVRNSSNPFTDSKDGSRGSDSVNVLVDPAAVNTHVRALKSPELAQRVADELKLADLPEFNSALGSVDRFDAILRTLGLSGPRPGESEQDRVLNNLYKRTEVYTAKESRFIGVRVTSSDSVLAAEIANHLANAYRNSLAEKTVDEIDEVQKVLEEKIERLSKEVSETQYAVERYKGENDLFKGGQSKIGLPEQQLGELTAELTRAQAARSEIEARAGSARELMKAGTADTLPDAQKSPLIQALVQQRVRLEREISELSATLLPAHPRMRQLNADLDGLKKQLQSEISKLVESLEKEAKVAALREESISRGLGEIKIEETKRSGGRVELRRLEDIAKSKQNELERLMKDREEAKLKTRTRVVPVEVKILSKAMPSSMPVFPKKGAITALVAFATLLFGTAVVVTRALLRGARADTDAIHPMRRATNDELSAAAHASESAGRTRSDFEPVAHPQPPLDRNAEPKAHQSRHHSADVTEIASVPRLARHLRSNTNQTGGVRTLITGLPNMLDPTVEGFALAEELARDGLETILIDWSVDETGFSSRVGLDVTPGFNDLVLGTASFEDVIRNLPGGQIHVVPSGTSIGGRAVEQALDSEKLNLLLDALDEAYDQIIVVAKHSDARALFEAIQGRFDAGITVTCGPRSKAAIQEPPGTFLGFEVADIVLVRFNRASETPAAKQRNLGSGIAADARI